MMKKILYLGLVVFAMSICNVTISQAAKHVIQSTFNKNDEGWTSETNELAQVYNSKGGHPGGFLSIEDLSWAESGVSFQPAKFKGDLSRFNGGMISYDLILLRQPTTPISPNQPIQGGFGRIGLYGVDANAIFDYVHYPPIPPAPCPYTGYWKTYHSPLTAEAWHSTSDNWKRLLSNVTYFNISLDIGGQGIVGLDDFKIVDPSGITTTPESLSMILFGLGGAAMAFMKRKKSIV
jgi:hypothetical protein